MEVEVSVRGACGGSKATTDGGQCTRGGHPSFLLMLPSPVVLVLIECDNNNNMRFFLFLFIV